jgi:phage baseplate assembly protein W
MANIVGTLTNLEDPENKTVDTLLGTMKEDIRDKVVVEYSDLNLDFHAHPGSGDLIPLTNSESVKRAVRNIMFTAHNERLFNPNFGANLRQMLFQPITPATELQLKLYISNAIKFFEPRVKIIRLDVKASPDEYQYDVSFVFSIDGLSQQIEYETTLERLR